MDIGKLKYKSILFISSNEDEATNTILNDSFKNVIIENNHEESVNKYFGKERTSDAEIDLVLYDVDEHNIIHLKKIRDINQRIPLFVLSGDFAHIDSNLLTQQRIYYSFEKPLDKERFCKEVYYALKEVSKRKFNAYLRKVAIVSKTDVNGKIIFANELFCEISGYTNDELIDRPHNIVRHPGNPKSLYINLWKTIQEGKAWHGILKNRTKEGEDYYLNSTIFPTLNSKKEIIGYLNISFVVTTEEQNKAKLKQFILSQKSAQIKSNQEFEQKVEQRIEIALKAEKNRYNELRKIAYNLEDVLNKTKVGKNQLAKRVQYLEDTLKSVAAKDKDSDTQLKHQLREIRQENYETHKKNEKIEKLNEVLNNKFVKAQESITVFQGYIDEYRKKIDDLNDVIASNEKELGALKTKS